MLKGVGQRAVDGTAELIARTSALTTGCEPLIWGWLEWPEFL